MSLTYYEEIAHKTGVTLNPMQRYARQAEGFDRSEPRPISEDVAGDDDAENRSPFDPETGQRICCTCKTPKLASAYTKNCNKIDGRDARCRECKSELAAQRNLAAVAQI